MGPTAFKTSPSNVDSFTDRLKFYHPEVKESLALLTSSNHRLLISELNQHEFPSFLHLHNVSFDREVTKLCCKSVNEGEWPSLIEDYITTTYPDHFRIYTDGSYIDNISAASAFFIPREKLMVHIKLSPYSNSLLTEIFAIWLSIINLSNLPSQINKILILTDSLWSIDSIRKRHSSNHPIILSSILHHLYKSSGLNFVFCWIPSHRGIFGNSEIDSSLTRFVHTPSLFSASHPGPSFSWSSGGQLDSGGSVYTLFHPLLILPPSRHTSMSTKDPPEISANWAELLFDEVQIKSFVKKIVYDRWQQVWLSDNSGRFTFAIIPAVQGDRGFKPKCRKSEIVLNRFLTGNVDLEAYRHRFGLSTSPLCNTCLVTEDINHYLFSCKANDSPSRILKAKGLLASTSSLAHILNTRDLWDIVYSSYKRRTLSATTTDSAGIPYTGTGIPYTG